jgi:hypothetical protein
MAKRSELTVGSKHGVFVVVAEVPIDERRVREYAELILRCNYGNLHNRVVSSFSNTSGVAQKSCQTCRKKEFGPEPRHETMSPAVAFVNQERNK